MSDQRENPVPDDHPAAMSLGLKLSEKARPLFEDAVSHAHAQGMWVSLSSSITANAMAELVLSARFPDDDASSTYRLIADEANQRVLHEMVFARDKSTDRQETTPAALNDLVIDTQLQAFFSKAFGLHLDYLTDKRHPPGFW